MEVLPLKYYHWPSSGSKIPHPGCGAAQQIETLLIHYIRATKMPHHQYSDRDDDINGNLTARSKHLKGRLKGTFP